MPTHRFIFKKAALALVLFGSINTTSYSAVKEGTGVSAEYRKVYAARYAKAITASGQKAGAFTISKQLEKDGHYHLSIALADTEPAQKLLIRLRGTANGLLMIEAHVGDKKVYPSDSTEWSHLPICHIVSSRQHGASPVPLTIHFKKEKGAGPRFLRAGDLSVLTADQLEKFPDIKEWGPYRYEIELFRPGYGFAVTNNGQRSIADVGQCDELTFRGFTKDIKEWYLHKKMEDLIELHKIEKGRFYFTGAPQRVSDGSIIATRNNLPLKEVGNVSALIYFKSIDKNGNRELLVVRPPLNLASINWELVKKNRVKSSP